MTFKDFASAVRRQNRASGSPVEEPFVAQAVLSASEQGTASTPGDIQLCLARARQLEGEWTSNHSAQAERRGPIPDPEPAASADRLYDLMEEEVAELRLQIFGSSEVPFSDWKEAVSWIKEEVETARARPRDPVDWDAFDDLGRRIGELCRQMSRVVNLPVTMPQATAAVLPHYTKDFVMSMVSPTRRSDGTLLPLANFVNQASKDTGLPAEMITTFVLSGARLRPSITVKGFLALGFATKMPCVTITIPKTLPSWDDFKKAYRFLRESRGGAKGLSASTRKMIALIQQLDGIPKKGIMAFWEKVAKKMTEELGTPYTARAVRGRVERLPREMRESLMAE